MNPIKAKAGNSDTPATRSAVEAELRSFLLRDGFPEGELELSRTNEAISIATGEHSHKLLSPTADMIIAKNELAVLGGDHVGVTTDDYVQLLSALLPPGPAWSSDDVAIKGVAPSLFRAHQRGDDLMLELDPRTTTELIERWERCCGLPDECIPSGTQTLRQRQ